MNKKFYLKKCGLTMLVVSLVTTLFFGELRDVAAVTSDGIKTQNLSTGIQAEDLVHSLIGNNVTVQNVKIKGTEVSAGKFTGGTGIIGFDDGVVLSSGNITNIVGPNLADFTTYDAYIEGDSDLDQLIPGYFTADAAVLEFDFIPKYDMITFQYVFGSEEYNEWVNSEYNDVFGFFVNGQNMAVIPGTSTPVSINNVNLKTNSNYYINNDRSDGGGKINTSMDGFTTVLYVEAPVKKGEVNHMKMAIADAGDTSLDSHVLIRAESFISKPNPYIQHAPEVTATPDSLPNGNGWSNKDVTVSFSATDDDNDLVSVDSPVTITTEGQGINVEGTAVDSIGNVGKASLKLNIDKTAPNTNASLSGDSGTNGWHKSDVTIHLEGTDNLSGVTQTEYSLDNGVTWNNYKEPIVVSEEGEHTVYYRSTDMAGNIENTKKTIVKIDKTNPGLTLKINNSMLWPPNHKMVNINVDIASTDEFSGISSIKLFSITSNEADEGLGDGDFINDIQGAEYGTDDRFFQLRAERMGMGEGRIYTVTYVVTDIAGNETFQSISVTVPKSQSQKGKN
jgi:hypothetical protein